MSIIIDRFINSSKNEVNNNFLNERISELHNLLVSKYEASFRNMTIAEQKKCLQALLNDIRVAEKREKKLQKIIRRG